MRRRENTFNFSAGPAHLPDEVLKKAQAELLNWQQRGLSIMEMSHRSPDFIELAEQITQQLRDLLQVPEHYQIIYMQGGASLQFATVPLNLLGQHKNCQYIESGHWSKKATHEARRFAQVNCWKSWEKSPAELSCWEDPASWPIDSEAAFLHFTSNETVHGIAFPDLKIPKAKKIAVDMSSDILSRQINVANYDLIYACAQKNMGTAGVTFVIINPDCIDPVPMPLPSYLEYKTQIEKKSMVNTPPTFSLYLSGLIFQWVKEQGGVEVLQKRNQLRAGIIYDVINQHPDYYRNAVPTHFRSNMNICFHLPSPELDKKFVATAEEKGLLGLKGHRAAGGIRISLYNHQNEQAAPQLAAFMLDFIKNN